MSINKILLEKISKEETNKLNVSTCLLESPPKKNDRYLIYNRLDAQSSFYNSKSIRTGTFYKSTSLFFTREIYESLLKLNKNTENE